MISSLVLSAWIVLWVSVAGGRPDPRAAFETQHECDLAIVRTLNEKRSAGFHTETWGWIYQGQDGKWRIVTITCLPDSIDPRR